MSMDCDSAIAQWITGGDTDMDSAIGDWALSRGGVRRRIQAANTAGASTDEARPSPSVLASLLSEQNAWGLMSAELAQRIASAAVSDCCSKSEVIDLPRLGVP